MRDGLDLRVEYVVTRPEDEPVPKLQVGTLELLNSGGWIVECVRYPYTSVCLEIRKNVLDRPARSVQYCLGLSDPRRFGKIRAIIWNIKVLNRLRYSPDTWDRDTILRYGVMRMTVQV